MGTKMPRSKTDTKYKKRIAVPRAIRIISDGQLVAAQRFNEQLDAVLGQIDNHIFPADRIDPVLIERLYESAELVQSAVVEGIVDYHIRGVQPVPQRPASMYGSEVFEVGGYADNLADEDQGPYLSDTVNTANDPSDAGDLKETGTETRFAALIPNMLSILESSSATVNRILLLMEREEELIEHSLTGLKEANNILRKSNDRIGSGGLQSVAHSGQGGN
jgi:hypothetical protein